eukprot:m.235056 g.235056  ORF g.235056 m.235056 type:complete len:327 (+) comp54309_c0_seq7:867-1847(+)
MDRTRLEHALRKDILKPPNKHALESVLSVSLEGQLKSDTDLAKVMQQIATHCPNVVDINFSGPHPGGFKIKDTTPLRLLRHCPKLTTIFLNDNWIANVDPIVEGLIECPKIQSIFLEGNLMTDDNLESIYALLVSCKRLRTIQMHRNLFSRTHLDRIAQAAAPHPTIESLRFASACVAHDHFVDLSVRFPPLFSFGGPLNIMPELMLRYSKMSPVGSMTKPAVRESSLSTAATEPVHSEEPQQTYLVFDDFGSAANTELLDAAAGTFSEALADPQPLESNQTQAKAPAQQQAVEQESFSSSGFSLVFDLADLGLADEMQAVGYDLF